MRDRTGAGHLPIGRQSLSLLEAATDAYRTDNRGSLEHHRLWGHVQAEWIRLLEHPTEADRQRLAPLYSKQCNVVGATCSCCGNWREFLSRPEFARFDIVIIDEVSKATPPELLLAALLGRKLILGGDFRQLPPTFKEGPRRERTFTEMAEVDEEFEQVMRFQNMVTASLFKKLFQDAPDVIKQYLEEQYRMHPQIMEVINQFYDGRLRCGITDPDEKCAHGLTIKTRRGEFLSPGNHVLWVDSSQDAKGRWANERQVGSSKANDLEAQLVTQLIKMLNDAARGAGKAPGSLDVAVITFYGAQKALIRRQPGLLKKADKEMLDIRLDTVDNFQGAERSVVIVSLVRSKRGSIGEFAKTFERINVAMSRAQKLLVVLGAMNTFAKLEIPLPTPEGQAVPRRCYAHILDVVKRYGGSRLARDIFQ
jgi:superfamily I DNA and/or RNA helicase